MVRFVRCTSLALLIGAAPSLVLAQPADEEPPFRILHPAPDASGRYLCATDDVATDAGYGPVTKCDVGGDTVYRVRHNTVVEITTIERTPIAPQSLSLLDYWKLHLAEDWERRFDTRPTNIVIRNSDNLEYLEASWDRADGVRELITVTHRRPTIGSRGWRLVKRTTLDCRPSPARAIGCF